MVAVEVRGCLHLKTAATALTEESLIANPAWIDLRPLAGFRLEPVAADEPWAGNVLTCNGRAILHSGHRRAADAIARLGIEARGVGKPVFLDGFRSGERAAPLQRPPPPPPPIPVLFCA